MTLVADYMPVVDQIDEAIDDIEDGVCQLRAAVLEHILP
jgi:hypothetical protein